MEKRLTLAIALSLVVLLLWSKVASKFYPVENKEVIVKEAPFGLSLTKVALPPAPTLITDTGLTKETFSYAQEKWDLRFLETQAAIQEVVFKAYQDYPVPLKYAFFWNDPALVFKKTASDASTITFLHNDPAKKITKKFIFDNSNYTIGLEIKIRNLSASPLKIQIPLILGGLDFSSRDLQARYQDALLVTKEKAWHSNARKDLSLPELKFAGLRERYFCSIIQPPTSDYTGQVRKITPTESAISICSPELNIGPQEEITQLYRIYLGPQELQRINRIQPEWSAIIYYGIFDLIAQVLMQFLGFLYGLAHNWGLAIIFLSLAIYSLLYPLSLKQMRSMKEMQVLQPQIEALRITYKDNPQKLNKEIMELYREHKVNPLGGCLPLLLQMPIFFALYQVLMRSVVLRGAKFLWIKDLSGPDKLFTLSGSLPVIGNEINILPIIMAIGMFFQQKISAASSTGTSAEQQKIMLILFPLMFGFIFYHMPAGLVLYWFVNSGLMLASQLRMNRQK